MLEWCIVIQGNIHVPAIFSINRKYIHVSNISFYSLFSRPRLSFFVHLQTFNNTLFFFQTIFQVCQNVIQSQYVLGVQRIQHYGNSLEFKLLGNPWNCGIDGHDGLHGRSLICHLINALASRSWRLSLQQTCRRNMSIRIRVLIIPLMLTVYSLHMTPHPFSYQHHLQCLIFSHIPSLMVPHHLMTLCSMITLLRMIHRPMEDLLCSSKA